LEERLPDLPTRWLRDVLIVTIVASITVLAATAARPMVTYRALGLGASSLDIGLVQSAYAVLPMLTAIAIGRWVDRAGERLVSAVGCAVMTVGAVVLAISPSLIGLAAGQVLMGFGIIVMAIATQSFVANHGPAHRQVHRFGWFSVAVSSGQIAGPAAVAVLVPTAATPAGTGNQETTIFVIAAAISAFSALLVRALPAAPRPQAARRRGPEAGLARSAARILRAPGIASAMFVSLAVASGLDVLIVYLPAFGEAHGLTVATVGSLLAVRAGATLVSRAFLGRLTERLGPGSTLMITSATAALATGLLATSPPVPILFGLMILIGIGLGVGQPLTVAWIGIQAPPHERGLAFGVRHTGNLATLAVVPAAMGVVAGATGINAIWLVMAGFLAAGAVVARRTRFAA
jgi:MFS family permease